MDPAELRRLYVDENLGCPEIAARINADPKTIWEWLIEAGIPRRSRGSGTRHHFPKGHKLRVGQRHTAATRERIRLATVSDGRVPYLRNGQHWLKGSRPEENPKWRGGITPERQAFYRSEQWKTACVAVWHRADAKCERCGKDNRVARKAREPTFHVHHIVSFQVRELRAAVSNLALLCCVCHMFVHSKENAGREFLPADLQGAERELSIPDLFASDEAQIADEIPFDPERKANLIGSKARAT
jgi:hypothetical protein